MNSNEQFKDLFERYLKGQCTAEELNLLLKYFRETDIKEASVARLIRENLNNDIPLHHENSFAVQEAIDDVHSHIHAIIQQEKKARLKKISLPAWMRMAAVWLMLFSALGLLIYYRGAKREMAVPMQQLITQKGERAKIILPDGTKIWLSPSSQLDYPQHFTGDNRTVKLTGEAFFDVAPDKTHPFIIQSGEMSTKVVGTSFNIKSYQEQELAMVTVVTGKVNVSMKQPGHKIAGEVNLEPNQRAVFNKSSHVLNKENYPQAAKLLNERDGKFVFEGTPVSEVLDEVEQQYNLTILVKGDISQCKFYGELNTRENITLFLKKLSLAIHAKWKENNGLYTIEAKGCD